MIGIFDSGVGGLTVFSEIKKEIPGEELLYFGDTARVPWGNKSESTIQKYSEEIVKFLISEGAEKIVIACNTSSAFAANHLREKFPEIYFHDVISPFISKVFKKEEGNVLVIGTRATVKSEAYIKALKNSNLKGTVYSQACPLFVPFIEEGMQDDPLLFDVARRYLGKFKEKKIKYVILGCTHYPLIESAIKKVFDGKVEVISAAREVAIEVHESLNKKRAQEKAVDKFYFSDWNTHSEFLLKKIIGSNHRVEIHKLET